MKKTVPWKDSFIFILCIISFERLMDSAVMFLFVAATKFLLFFRFFRMFWKGKYTSIKGIPLLCKIKGHLQD